MMTMAGGGGGPAMGGPPPPQQQQQQQQQQQPMGMGTIGVGMGGIGAGNGNTVERRMRPEDAAMHITVSDPVQHSEGINKYTSYRVDVRPPNVVSSDDPNQNVMLTAPGAPQQNNNYYSAVLRRYSDFLWLFEKLHVERAGAIIPPIPEKQPVGRFSPQFVEERRVQLERFLRRVSIHPELADTNCLDTFLRADDVTFQAAKNAKDDGNANNMGNMGQSMMMPQPQANYGSQMMPPGAGAGGQPLKKEGFKRWFAETKTSISGDLVKSPDDDLFHEINRYIYGLDTQMKNVSQQATGLVRKGKEIANGLFEFGLAFNLLGQSEADSLGDALGKMGETADKLSVISANHAEKEMINFEEPLQDYIKIIHSVKLALQRRHEKRLTYSTCLGSVESKQAALNKLRMQHHNPMNDSKIYQAEMSLRRAQEIADVARDDFAAVSQRLLREVDRFKREKAEDMRRTVLDYINLQVEYNKQMENIWSSLIPQLERVQLQTTTSGNNSNNNNAAPPPPSTGGDASTPQPSNQNNNSIAHPVSPDRGQPQQLQQPIQQPQYGMIPPAGGPPLPGGNPPNDPSMIQYRNHPNQTFPAM